MVAGAVLRYTRRQRGLRIQLWELLSGKTAPIGPAGEQVCNVHIPTLYNVHCINRKYVLAHIQPAETEARPSTNVQGYDLGIHSASCGVDRGT